LSVETFASVVVPTRNRAALLGDCLHSLRGQDYPKHRYEIVVVDDGSTDATEQVVLSAARDGRGAPIRLIRQPPRGVNAARNRGIRHANGSLVCFVDDDVDTPVGWLKALVRGADQYPQAHVFVGRILLRIEGRTPKVCGRETALWEAYQLDLGEGDCEIDDMWGGNLALRRSAISLAGPFDASLPYGGSDTEWVVRYLRAGGRVMYLGDALVWHRRTTDALRLSSLARQQFQQGRGRAFSERASGKGRTSTAQDVEELVRGIGHAVKRLCASGLLRSAYSSGRLWGRLSLPYRRVRGTSRRA
jgi:glycosyltransferase involved in cell wall biosynthesis